MTIKTFSFNIVLPSWLLLITMMLAVALSAAGIAGDKSKQPTFADGSTQQAASDVRGIWSGTFYSNHSNVTPFTMTVVINPNSRAHLIGSSTLNAECLRGAQLEVTVTGSTVVLAGSDEEGDDMTVRGTLDTTGTVLTSTYILNGSATGRCETDDGTGSLTKR